MKSLTVTDILNGFIIGTLGTSQAQDALKSMKAKIAECRKT